MTTSALTVRFSPEMREQLELVANKEHRSINNQVIHFIAQSLDNYLREKGLCFKADGDSFTFAPLAEGLQV
jgi:hypothetical protein